MKKTLLILLSAAFGFNVAKAQTTIQVPAAGPTAISLSAVNVPYTQNFLKVTGVSPDTEGLQSGGSNHTNLPIGWAYSERTKSATTDADGLYGSSNGGGEVNATGRGVFSFGITNTAEDRALGAITGGGTGTVHYINIGVKFANNTGETITSLTVQYTGEQWRRFVAISTGNSPVTDGHGNYPKSKLSFTYRIGDGLLDAGTWIPVTQLDFESPVTNHVGLLDGNIAANREAKSLTISGLNIPNGTTFWLKWRKDSDIEGVGNNDGLAIDDFSLIPNPSTQPVNLKSFNYQKTGSSVQLKWQTVSELNNDRFELSRSSDGSKFDLLTSVSGKGTSNEVNNYNYTDFNPLSGTSYYQLKQFDKNGDAKTYPLLPVSTTEAEELTLGISKAGASSANLKIYAPTKSSGVLSLYDLGGKQLLSKQLNLSKGHNDLSLELPTINGGVYIFKLSANGAVATKKVALL